MGFHSTAKRRAGAMKRVNPRNPSVLVHSPARRCRYWRYMLMAAPAPLKRGNPNTPAKLLRFLHYSDKLTWPGHRNTVPLLARTKSVAGTRSGAGFTCRNKAGGARSGAGARLVASSVKAPQHSLRPIAEASAPSPSPGTAVGAARARNGNKRNGGGQSDQRRAVQRPLSMCFGSWRYGLVTTRPLAETS